ncbi:hypothetical protein [Jannaschia sp. M317]|uniref:hypothetical protein n=1 Tax=Jannaschia sp. M317 TaxID=2867011 RepID=UPI0021A5E015|nr:hypothetical protein [Jannaschia sp. M317]UWQ18036.1 hypothetical protein K3551_01640 [Jannaschia sp. M317]
MILLRALPLLLLATAAQAGVDGPLPAGNPAGQRLIEAAADVCTTEDAGDLIVEDGAYTAADLDGDGDEDLVISFDHVFCQFNAARWAGTAGTPKHFILDGTTAQEVWGGDWQTVDVPPFADDPTVTERLILVPVHGGQCDGYGAQPCWRVLSTFDGGFSTLPLVTE